MGLEKRNKVSKIEIEGDYKIIFIEEELQIIEDGIVLSSRTHRTSHTPDNILITDNEDVKEIAKKFWTTDLIANYKAYLLTLIVIKE